MLNRDTRRTLGRHDTAVEIETAASVRVAIRNNVASAGVDLNCENLTSKRSLCLSRWVRNRHKFGGLLRCELQKILGYTYKVAHFSLLCDLVGFSRHATTVTTCIFGKKVLIKSVKQKTQCA